MSSVAAWMYLLVLTCWMPECIYMCVYLGIIYIYIYICWVVCVDLLLKTAFRWKEVNTSAIQITVSSPVKLQENSYLHGKSKPFTIKKIMFSFGHWEVPGWVNVWSSGFHGKVSTAEIDAPVDFSFFWSGILLPKHVLSIEFHLSPAWSSQSWQMCS